MEQAVQIAKRIYDRTKAEKLSEKETSQIIYPEKTETGIVYYLAWKFLLASERPDPALEKYFIIDAIEGKILLSYDARPSDAEVSGEAQGEIYPENPNAPPVTTMPLEHEYVDIHYAGRARTNATGDYSIRVSWWWRIITTLVGGGRYTFRLEGPYSRVRDSDGSDFEFTQMCNTTNPCDHNWTAADRDHINVFYHMNLFHDWLRGQLGHSWINAWYGTRQFKAEVNRPINNARAGNPMLFGVDPFARSSDVIYHECTHNVLYHIYGDWIGIVLSTMEGYAMDEGFSDYFASSFTDDSAHGEGYGGTRNLNNNDTYPGKYNYNIGGHQGGQIIGGAAWDLRNILIAEMGQQRGTRLADRLIFDAHQILANRPRDYYFSDPQESNFLSCLYLADDDNDNLEDGVPHFVEIHRAFANHNLLQAVLFNGNSFDFSANTVGEYSGGDLYYSGGKFFANNVGQRGVRDLGDICNVPLDQVSIPTSGYTRFGVQAATGHTYVSLAQQGEEGHHIIFRVQTIDGQNITIDFLYI